MKFTILLAILFDLLAKRKVTATYFAQKHDISIRTVYRYIDQLSISVPVYVKRGRNGGILSRVSYRGKFNGEADFNGVYVCVRKRDFG